MLTFKYEIYNAYKYLLTYKLVAVFFGNSFHFQLKTNFSLLIDENQFNFNNLVWVWVRSNRNIYDLIIKLVHYNNI